MRPPGAGLDDTTCSGTSSYRNVPVQARNDGSATLPDAVTDPAAMLMACWPCAATGLVAKPNCAVFASTTVTDSAGAPLTVKSTACRLAEVRGWEKSTVKDVGAAATTSPPAGAPALTIMYGLTLPSTPAS